MIPKKHPLFIRLVDWSFFSTNPSKIPQMPGSVPVVEPLPPTPREVGVSRVAGLAGRDVCFGEGGSCWGSECWLES